MELQILGVVNKSYSFEGKSGVSHQLQCFNPVTGEVGIVKVKEDNLPPKGCTHCVVTAEIVSQKGEFKPSYLKVSYK